MTTNSKVNDVLEDFGAATDMLVAGAYARISKCEDFDGRRNQVVLDMAFEVLCVLVGCMTKDEILAVLERIRM
jgi:hypothetical protein